jgi:hypothetical protein
MDRTKLLVSVVVNDWVPLKVAVPVVTYVLVPTVVCVRELVPMAVPVSITVAVLETVPPLVSVTVTVAVATLESVIVPVPVIVVDIVEDAVCVPDNTPVDACV